LYAAAIKIKAEGDQRGRDDTGLNAVALFCLPLDWSKWSLYFIGVIPIEKYVQVNRQLHSIETSVLIT
jgi:hypothetical protein